LYLFVFGGYCCNVLYLRHKYFFLAFFSTDLRPYGAVLIDAGVGHTEINLAEDLALSTFKKLTKKFLFKKAFHPLRHRCNTSVKKSKKRISCAVGAILRRINPAA